MEDLTETELQGAKRLADGLSDSTAALTIRRLVAEVERRRAERPTGKRHEITLTEEAGVEQK